MFKKILDKHKKNWSDRKIIYSSLIGVLFFSLSLFVNDYSSDYATKMAISGNYVQDILLSNLPVFNVGFIVNNMAVMFLIFILVLLFMEPKKMSFFFKTVALFIVIRSGFVMLTHLGIFPERSYLDPDDLLNFFNIGGDYFFSGHTGLPFLAALIFWDEKWIRYTFLIASIVFGASVILGHLHYSIDVFSAFFITYTIFHIAKKFFANDYRLANLKEE